jgi:endonuclease YncB( thermonuclease family)
VLFWSALLVVVRFCGGDAVVAAASRNWPFMAGCFAALFAISVIVLPRLRGFRLLMDRWRCAIAAHRESENLVLEEDVSRFDFWLAGSASAAAFIAAFTLGAFVRWSGPILQWSANNWIVLVAGASMAPGIFALLWPRLKRAPWFRRFTRICAHEIGNRIGVGDFVRVSEPAMINGDTVQDGVTGALYRIANIDAPEIGVGAPCFHARQKGEAARRSAIRAIGAAHEVCVRATRRIDGQGRRIAFVYVDGADLGEGLIAQGLAAPWKGYREHWCGGSGLLSKITRKQGGWFACSMCAHRT